MRRKKTVEFFLKKLNIHDIRYSTIIKKIRFKFDDTEI